MDVIGSTVSTGWRCPAGYSKRERSNRKRGAVETRHTNALCPARRFHQSGSGLTVTRKSSNNRNNAMIRKGRLFTPGRTQLLPSAQLAMAAATMHHRTAEFRALYSRVLSDLKTFVGTRNDLVMFTASGTGAMEAAVANLTSPGDKVLIVSAGKFGESWEGLAKAYGLRFETVRAPYGDTVTPQQVREKLQADHRV